MTRDAGPLRDQHRAEMERRTRMREPSIVQIVKRYASARDPLHPSAKAMLDLREKRELIDTYGKYALESFVVWAANNKKSIEHPKNIRTPRHERQEYVASIKRVSR